MAAILGTGTQRAAKTSRVGIGALYLALASWEARVTGADLPTVNFQSYIVNDAQTYAEGIMGVLGCDFNFGGAWDAGVRPFVNPPGLYPRDDLAAVTLVTSRLDGTAWQFTYARIRSASNSAAVEGLVLFNVTDAKNQGQFATA